MKFATKAVETYPLMAMAYDLRGLCWIMQKKWDEALKDINMSVQIDPDDAVFENHKFMLLFSKEQFYETMDKTFNLNRSTSEKIPGKNK